MSLPLRHSLDNVTSIDRIVEDLLVRFIINCPPEDLSSVERELFHFEEASWFYTDFIKLMNPSLPSLKIKSLSQFFIKLCPLIWKWDIKVDEALQKFSKYKKTIPVRGAAIFNESLNKILLVKGTESDSWSFPRGKISKDESDLDCCIREVKEEIGFDLTDYIDEDKFVERSISGKNYKIFLIKNVSEDFVFKPQVRNEIDKIQWFDFKKINKMVHKNSNSHSSSSNGMKFYLINSMIRPLSMWLRNQKQAKSEDQSKLYAEEQLKSILGLTKKEEIDPGRDLLNLLHSAVQTNGTSNNNPVAMNPIQNNEAAPFHVPLPIGFQPFAPFPFANGNMPFNMQFNPIPLQSQILQHSSIPFTQPIMPPTSNQQIETPNITSLSRPSLIPINPENNPKELLNLLKSKKEPNSSLSEQSPKSDSSNILLNVLQRNSKKSYSPEFQPGEAVMTNENEKEQDYEEFEESSSEEEEAEDNNDEFDDYGLHKEAEPYFGVWKRSPQPMKSRSTSRFEDEDKSRTNKNSYKDFEEEERELKESVDNLSVHHYDREILKENDFKEGEVPHNDNVSDTVKSIVNSTRSIGSFNKEESLNPNFNNPPLSLPNDQTSMNGIKPMDTSSAKTKKFKILKRGENLEAFGNASAPDTPNESSALLLNLLKKPSVNANGQISELAYQAASDDHQQVGSAKSTETFVPSVDNISLEVPTHSNSSTEKTNSTNTELMNMLRKNSKPSLDDKNNMNEVGALNGHELLNMLKHNSNVEEQKSPQNELLNILKKNFSPTKNTSISNATSASAGTGANQFSNLTSSNSINTSGNELLSLLKKSSSSNENQEAINQNNGNDLLRMLQKRSSNTLDFFTSGNNVQDGNPMTDNFY
ncbi:hypothetical protein KAFR_0J02070 [Kazachstania africana CBS 2517]|uniref:Nudix hydrolase domain-containing protein n=1 Tax=Kazachstania africana (strain ATCC 22294 / BCRC 22015 / CBS 2517 / CECT 1963 / NBRC 1671 / NRRL Y-8276) TaxID=1071382 RepID=H2B0X1_KAZAF|nr:hypothetical protein KAFR_0J02070 [Kazachstania africana CBS 2517]CCF60271.1 hypothetical protein KAFR_0J02070 [Kazachstania africana CBS 2517]